MAHCSKCGRDVGCGCNLISGLCAKCYSETLDYVNDTPQNKVKAVKSKRVIYKKPEPNQRPTSEFSDILKTPGISREEKLKRINEILEKALQ